MADGPGIWIQEKLTPYTVFQHGVKRLLEAKETEFQRMCVADIGPYGRALVLDGKMQTTTGDEFLYHEPIVHVPSIVHGSPKKVLVLGGADLGAAREALKWRSVETVVVVDIDQEVFRACQEYLEDISQGCVEDKRCEFVVGDALEFIETTSDKFDVIIGDLTDPIEEGPSRQLFTVSFYTRVKRCLTPEGVYVTQAGSISLLEEQVFPRVANTLKQVFGHVLPFTSFVPTYGTPLGFLLAADFDLASVIDGLSEGQINEILDKRLSTGASELRGLDGKALLGHFGLPLYVRRAIAAETIIYE